MLRKFRIRQKKWFSYKKNVYFALIFASWNLIYCPIVENQSDSRKYWFHAKQSQKSSTETRFKSVNAFSECFVFVRVAANQRLIICKRNCWKIPEHIVYLLCFTLFRMHVRNTAPEKELDIAIQITQERVLTPSSKQNRNGLKSN